MKLLVVTSLATSLAIAVIQTSFVAFADSPNCAHIGRMDLTVRSAAPGTKATENTPPATTAIKEHSSRRTPGS